jgi:Fe-S cluster assembly iron-binding protein IscA
MLTVTDQAVSAIDSLLASRELPEEAGVRVTADFNPTNSDTPEPQLQLQVVEGPEPGDRVVDGAPVFLEPSAANILENRTLDADLSGDTMRFALR